MYVWEDDDNKDDDGTGDADDDTDDTSDLSEPSTPEFGTDEGLMQKKKKHTIDFDLLKGKEVRALGVYGCACVRACMRQLHYIFPEVV